MIAVVNYGLGNLRSVSKAIESLGAKVKVTGNPKEIAKAEAIVLPGVGAFHQGMKNIKQLGLSKALIDIINQGKPFLGICLGLQLLFTESEEHGIHKGLDIIKGRVIKFTKVSKIPHMGWNQVKIKNLPTKSGSRLFVGKKSTLRLHSGLMVKRVEPSKVKIFEGIPQNSYFYFVHSYYVQPRDKDIIVGTTKYGVEFTSVIHKDNVWGVQFHPEKSSDSGLQILKNFISMY